MRKTTLATLFISVSAVLFFVSPFDIEASTTIQTPVTFLASGSGSSTTTSASIIDLDSITIPALDPADHLHVSISYKGATATPQQIGLNWNGDFTIDTITHNINNYNMIECDFYPRQDQTTAVEYWCREANTIPSTPISIASAQGVTYTSTSTLKLRNIPGSALSRTMKWAWTVSLINGVVGTTSITEEDGLSHIRFQEEGSDVIANPDVLNFAGDCITLTNPSSTITGLLTSTCGTGGGGGFGITAGGISTAQAQEVEATLNASGDVLQYGLTDSGWSLLNSVILVIVFLGAVIVFLLAFTVGRSYMRK